MPPADSNEPVIDEVAPPEATKEESSVADSAPEVTEPDLFGSLEAALGK